jgi:hypothetical protein
MTSRKLRRNRILNYNERQKWRLYRNKFYKQHNNSSKKATNLEIKPMGSLSHLIKLMQVKRALPSKSIKRKEYKSSFIERDRLQLSSKETWKLDADRTCRLCEIFVTFGEMINHKKTKIMPLLRKMRYKKTRYGKLYNALKDDYLKYIIQNN